ncbi:MAG TPA: class I mannose-6-phosphate isomerase, partial [Clostridia bacterium]|nr:class I mannose-6-phosphate isomerase [Clostridia bacterium]
MENYGWSFDGVPEENALKFDFGGGVAAFPALTLVKALPKDLLGGRVYGRFGAEFPIRFDFLDTFDGGNLSLQVHPMTGYIQETFGMHYTQDESYYILDADKDSCVYLGVKPGADPDAMRQALEEANAGGRPFDAERFVNRFPVQKHDHVLIPAGTVHCSGKNTLVLEISATPYIFTFKLWDWGRLGLDDLPRPVHIEHGMKNIQFDRDTEWVQRELIHRNEMIEQSPGLTVERTGLHPYEPIETRRYTVSGTITLPAIDS